MKRFLLPLLLCALLLSGCRKNCAAHTDADRDDLCDRCGNSVVISIDIFTVNDLHGKLVDAATQPGVDELTTYLQAMRAENENTLLLSIGDTWQGGAESNQTHGRIMTDWMNRLDFDAMTLGNHEFDWGEGSIEVNEELAEFPFLAINVMDIETGERAAYCDSSVLLECGGVQVGIIGAIGDCYSSIAIEQVEDLYFAVGDELTQLVKEESEYLRSQGADVIIYAIHDGMAQTGTGTVSGSELSAHYDVELSNGWVDLVFEAHTHHKYLLQDQYGVYHLQNGGDNNGGICHVQLDVHCVDGQVQSVEPKLISTTEYDQLEDDPMIAELLEEYAAELEPIYDIVGTIPTSQTGNTLRQLVADLYYLEGLLRWGSEYDIVLGGGYISIREPGYLARGEITYGQLQGLFPFDNELVLCSIRGQDLLERFLQSDNSNYFICLSDYGVQVQENLDPNATYYVVVDTYSSTYAPNRLTEIERYGASIYARDLLANYIAGGGLGG